MKKMLGVLFAVALICIIVHPCEAEACYLAEVVLFDQPAGSSTEGGPPEEALGAPDGVPGVSGRVAIDIPETLIVAFPANLSASDGEGADLHIYEVSNGDSEVDVFGSEDNNVYVKLGTPNGDVDYDLSDYPSLDYVKYLKFVGLDDGGTTAGFDLDAVEAFYCRPDSSTCAGSAASTVGVSPVYSASVLGKQLAYFLLPLGAIIALRTWRRKK